MRKMEKKSLRSNTTLKFSLIVAITALLLAIGISPIAQTTTSTTTSSVSGQSAQSSVATSSSNVQTTVESLNTTFSIIINNLKQKGYNTTELEQTVSQMLQAIENDNYALGRAFFIKAVNIIYNLEVGNITSLQTMEQQRMQLEIMKRIQMLNQSISNMSFLTQDVRQNLTQTLNQAAQQVESGNYSVAVQLMERVMVQLREMNNELNRARVMTMLTTMAMERADKINNMTGRTLIEKNKLEEKDVVGLALKVRGLGFIEKEMKGAIEGMNVSWMYNTSEEEILKGKLGEIVIGKAKSMPETFFMPAQVMLQVAQDSLERAGKIGKQQQSEIQTLNNIISQEKDILNTSMNAAKDLMEGNTSSISILNQSLVNAQQLLSQVVSMNVSPQLQNIKQLIRNSLEFLIRDIQMIMAMQQSFMEFGKNILIKGVITEINGNNLTVLGTISPGSLVMGRGGASVHDNVVLLPTNWTVVLTNTTDIRGNLTLYAPVLVHGTIVNMTNHVVRADKLITVSSTMIEEQENESETD